MGGRRARCCSARTRCNTAFDLIKYAYELRRRPVAFGCPPPRASAAAAAAAERSNRTRTPRNAARTKVFLFYYFLPLPVSLRRRRPQYALPHAHTRIHCVSPPPLCVLQRARFSYFLRVYSVCRILVFLVFQNSIFDIIIKSMMGISLGSYPPLGELPTFLCRPFYDFY